MSESEPPRPPREQRSGWGSSQPRAERARQVADVLRQQITCGAFQDGVLPDERVLGADLHASRNAVREALSMLRAEGLVTRRRGVGTTVVAPAYGHGLDRLAGLAEVLDGHGALVNEVRAARPVSQPPAAIADRLALPPGAGAVYVERVRRLGGVALSLDTSYLAADIGLPLLECDLAGRDLFALIEETSGHTLGRAELSVHAVTASPDVAALLDIRTGAAVFAIDRLTHLADGRPVDAESLHIRADRMTLHATLHRRPPTTGN